jgi:hypothetical protein
MAAIKGLSYTDMLQEILSATETRLNGHLWANAKNELVKL